MWKKLSVSCVILVLVLGQLAAWPTWLTGKPAETEVLQIQTSPGQTIEDASKEQILLLRSQVKELESLSSGLQKKLDTLTNNLEKSGTKLNNTAATAESLLTEIEKLRDYSQALETSREVLENDYDALKAEYDLKADEANKYFQGETNAVAKYNAIASQKKNLWSTTVGAAAVMKGGEYGVDATVGVGYGPITIFGGATYMLGDGPFSFKMDDLAYKAGLTFTF